MKQIYLNKGHIALVDDEDYDYLNQFKWHAHLHHSNIYAIRTHRENGTKRKWSMHRIVLNLTNKNIICDHIDGNGLNNQKSNLRKCTNQENIRNRKPHKNKTSPYLGVHRKICKKTYITKNGPVTSIKTYWEAKLNNGVKDICLGLYVYNSEGEILAAKAYDKKAKELYGEFANLNFKN